MDFHHERYNFHIGQRTIKTAAAATLCALVYLFFDRNPTFACIGAIFGLGNGMSHSILNGGNRFFGTLFGGFLGMGLFHVYIHFIPEGGFHAAILPLLFIGVVLLIKMSQICQWVGAVQPGGVMLCIILFNTPVETYVSYSLNRIVDTGIGVIFALLVNRFFPRELVTKWLVAMHFKKAGEEESADKLPCEGGSEAK